MLSIGKVGGGHADPAYYVENVAWGADEYYAGHGEAPGTWHGAGAQARGLAGTVEDGEFLEVLVGDAAAGKTVLGYDLTFSAPKSVSLLYGLGDEVLSRAVRDAHDEAVRQSLDYVEREACWTRRGRGGKRHVAGEGLTVATFRHRTSRAGDPQLHTHAVVANATQAEGKTTSLDGRALYAHGRTAGYLYQAALRGQMTERVGVHWGPVEKGMAEIDGFDGEVLRHFSQRSQAIERQLAERGVRSTKAARIAKLETRPAKPDEVPLPELREQWRRRAADHGLGPDELAAVVDHADEPRPLDVDENAERMSAASGVTRQASTFDRRDAVREWAAAHREGASVAQVEDEADRWLQTYALRLEDAYERPGVGGPRWSTPDMLATEQQLLDLGRERQGGSVGMGDVGVVREASTLSHEQREVVEHLVTSGDGVEIVRAAAGTGKTYAIAEARRAWEANGLRVYGVALSARAAVELESSSGIDATTIAGFERDLSAGHGLPQDAVLVVDEAGMVGTRTLARLADHCADRDAKLVLLGDDRQLPELEAGGAFRRLAEDLGSGELREVRRQSEAWDRQALDELRRGRVEAWATTYRDHGRVVAEPTARAVRDHLVEDWWRAQRTDDADAVMIAHRRSDVADLNDHARALMRADGRLGDDELRSSDGRTFAVGDAVLTKRNDRRLHLVNGARGRVTAVDPERRCATLELHDGTARQVDAEYLDGGHLHHGYAITAHAAQGATVDRAFVLGSDDLYREWGYTAMSRHRTEARYYVVSTGSTERALPGLDPGGDRLIDDVTDSLSRSGRKSTAEEVATPSPDEQAAARALERAARLEERIATVKPWQRKLGKELRESLRRHHADIARLAASALEAKTRDPATTAPSFSTHETTMSRDELRAVLQDPVQAVTDRIGPRPDSLAARDRWARAATQLVTDPHTSREPPRASLDLADTGLDL